MENFSINTKKTATLAIFEEPSVKAKSDELFETYKVDIESKIQEILDFLELTPSDEHFFENVTTLFKTNFYRRILKSAVELACSDAKQYNLLENVLHYLSYEMLAPAILTEPMIGAVIATLYNLSDTEGTKKINYSFMVFKLNHKYRSSNVLSFKKDISEEKNSCPECGCSCVCDESCGGDVNKCTSKIALTKKCNHHCSCYIAPFAEKHSDLFKNL